MIAAFRKTPGRAAGNRTKAVLPRVISRSEWNGLSLADPNRGRRPTFQPLSNVSTILYFEPSNESDYHGLQLKLNQRFSRGLQFLASYTFGKTLDYAGSPASGGGAVGGPQSVTLFRQSRGPAGFDTRHRFVLSWVWELPFGQGRALADSGLLKPILENWQFGGIVTLSTGRPFSVTLNTGVNNGTTVVAGRFGSARAFNGASWIDAGNGSSLRITGASEAVTSL